MRAHPEKIQKKSSKDLKFKTILTEITRNVTNRVARDCEILI